MENFMMKKVKNDTQIKEIARLAEIIWHEHFTPIIGEGQVNYMVDKFQSYSALTEQLKNGYEYYQIYFTGEFCGYCGIHPEENRLFLSKLYLKKEVRGKHLATHLSVFKKYLP